MLPHRLMLIHIIFTHSTVPFDVIFLDEHGLGRCCFILFLHIFIREPLRIAGLHLPTEQYQSTQLVKLVHRLQPFDSLTLYERQPRVGPGQSPFPSHPFTSPPSTLSFSIYTFSFLSFLLALSIFLLSILSHSTSIIPLRFQAECRRRRLSPALVFCVDFMLYVFFSQGCMLFSSYSI